MLCAFSLHHTKLGELRADLRLCQHTGDDPEGYEDDGAAKTCYALAYGSHEAARGEDRQLRPGDRAHDARSATTLLAARCARVFVCVLFFASL